MTSWIASGSGSTSTLTASNNVMVNGTLSANSVALNNLNVNSLNASTILQQSVPLLPAGIICMWSGSTPPSGWALCDGSTYTKITGGSGQITTPDLRGRFVLGHNSIFSASLGRSDRNVIGAVGGTSTHTLSQDEMPNHTHGMSTNGNHSHGLRNDQDVIQAGGTTRAISNLAGSNNYATSRFVHQGDHTHTITAVGGGQPHNNMPPYYVLAYIMKL